MIKKFFSAVGFVGFACAQLYAIENPKNNPSDLPLLSGYIGTFAKSSALGENKDSYGTINLSLMLHHHVNEHLSLWLGVFGAIPTLDSPKGNVNDYSRTHYVNDKAFALYQVGQAGGASFSVQAGRFESHLDWLGEHIQGVQAHFTKPLFGASTFRASATYANEQAHINREEQSAFEEFKKEYNSREMFAFGAELGSEENFLGIYDYYFEGIFNTIGAKVHLQIPLGSRDLRDSIESAKSTHALNSNQRNRIQNSHQPNSAEYARATQWSGGEAEFTSAETIPIDGIDGIDSQTTKQGDRIQDSNQLEKVEYERGAEPSGIHFREGDTIDGIGWSLQFLAHFAYSKSFNPTLLMPQGDVYTHGQKDIGDTFFSFARLSLHYKKRFLIGLGFAQSGEKDFTNAFLGNRFVFEADDATPFLFNVIAPGGWHNGSNATNMFYGQTRSFYAFSALKFGRLALNFHARESSGQKARVHGGSQRQISAGFGYALDSHISLGAVAVYMRQMQRFAQEDINSSYLKAFLQYEF
ncbi:hypothetical protein CQA49_03940 [Helicobacter sp. MIT 00-7814]|uniref:hypothetical protein n=1 Tax=unclassified Helicobacter TaxID=2593540 RepID=UPI000E1E2DBC|nr:MULTISPECIES: hypothetical protein [unclassified Helicobacter]RDU53018.1 hypothetical protein CQA37_07885 [Helicobacter sp. MIT 99-10781]RDU55364.1 hypothetical protein CQA49_03940 [Helicobacter sp. MIT 00-7814]